MWSLGFKTIQELETSEGILASSKTEIYGCVFGRDSLISALKFIRVYEKTHNPYFLGLTKKILVSLAHLQGIEVNIESGEEPGKCIHEFRPDNHERLTKNASNPWFVYTDGSMRNFDSVDATPLFLIASYRYWQLSHDDEFLESYVKNIRKGLEWILAYGDTNDDGLIDYRLHPDRKYGGLTSQSWMDSSEVLFHEDGEPVLFPVAPVEVQAYSYLALKLWSTWYTDQDNNLAIQLQTRAQWLKKIFQQKFIIRDGEQFSLAAAIDGNHKQLTSARSSMGHCLWASMDMDNDGMIDSLLESEDIPKLVERLFESDMFAPNAGIRTLSRNSRMYAPNSYHNGSIWPHDNSMIAEGLERLGFVQEAIRVRKSLISAIEHFNTPIELYVHDDTAFSEYTHNGQEAACKKQAWSAASLLSAMCSVYPESVSTSQ